MEEDQEVEEGEGSKVEKVLLDVVGGKGKEGTALSLERSFDRTSASLQVREGQLFSFDSARGG